TLRCDIYSSSARPGRKLQIHIVDNFGSTLNKLSYQSWITRDIIWPDFAETNTSKIAGLRQVGDSSILVILLNTGSINIPLTPDFVVEYTQFELFAGRNESPSSSFLRIYTQEIRGYTWLEFYKVKPKNRPPQSMAARPLMSDDYIDDQMPVWYREWEHIQTGKGLL
ncbi:hypothetical protein BKA56DRAFT_580710, partial [Ilyonectria sp. MPI-CAGE-AT-0026]